MPKDFASLANSLVVGHLDRACGPGHVPLRRPQGFHCKLVVEQLRVYLYNSCAQDEELIAGKSLCRNDLSPGEVPVLEKRENS